MIQPIKRTIRNFQKKYQYYKIQRKLKTLESINNFDPKKNIIITGSPRSGTTWLQELLCSVENTYPLFEPLYLHDSPEFKKIGFEWRQYIPEDNDWPEARELFEKLFRGKYLTPWMVSRVDADELRDSDFLIIKFVRANLLLPWLIKQFGFLKPPVLILRHPCAVIASQMKMVWKDVPSTFSMPETKFPEQYIRYEHILKDIKTTVEHLAARWCMDNLLLLNHPGNDKSWITVFYENLIMYPEKEISKIFNRLSLEISPDILNKSDKPSSVSRPDQQGKKKKSVQLQKWKKELSKTDIKIILDMTEKFGIGIYTDDILPVSTHHDYEDISATKAPGH